MNARGVADLERLKKDRAKKAVALAMQSRWEEAVVVNRAILEDFSSDLEACNRLGKALSELGRNREAKEAFQWALETSPNNSIARKNIERLERLGDAAPVLGARGRANPHQFIEESGKAGVTSLVNLASPEVLLKLAPGHPVQLKAGSNGPMVSQSDGEIVGQVEPKLSSRLIRLVKGGNQYEATVTSVAEQELTVIIRETYKHPSQAGIVSFPSKGSADYRVYTPSALLDSDVEVETDEKGPTTVKDWSDDDTEPGDDDAYSPVFHRIINTGNDAAKPESEEEF